jgi:hypothetical protein
MASHLGDWKERLLIQMLGMALRIRMYLEQYFLFLSGIHIFYIGIYITTKPIVNASHKLLGQHFRLHVPPAYECLLFALSAHSWPQNLLTLRAYYQQQFLAWAASYDDGGLDIRSRQRHDQWLGMLPCPILCFEEEYSSEEHLAVLMGEIGQ